MNFDHIFNWKLLAGSHDFPGPDGGTCINEAAIIAAGFEYKKVRAAADCPPCFSPVLSAYLIGINDMMPRGERQKLMRFVMRLSGSADTPVIEQQRIELIVLRTVQLIVSSAMRATHLSEQAVACANVKTFAECGEVAVNAVRAARSAWAARAANAARAARAKLYADCIAIAEEAFAIGKQAEPMDTARVEERLNSVKERVHA